MDTRAGIDIYQNVLRYAEVRQRGDRYQLLRLGSCEFDFDVAQAVHEGTPASHLDAFSDALHDVFEGSLADHLYVALHPPVCYSFFSPLPVEADNEERKKRLLRDAALLARAQAPQPLRLTADPVHTETLDAGDSVEWFHVLALNEQLHVRFDRILRLLPQGYRRMALSMHAVANLIERIEHREDASASHRGPFSLAVGWYPSHIELVLCRYGRWYFSQFTEAGTPADCSYFALALLQRLAIKPASVSRLFIYGYHEEVRAFESMADVFGISPEPLNPMQLFELDERSMAAQDALNAFGPCLGVTL